jgi:hypothetical protein
MRPLSLAVIATSTVATHDAVDVGDRRGRTLTPGARACWSCRRASGAGLADRDALACGERDVIFQILAPSDRLRIAPCCIVDPRSARLGLQMVPDLLSTRSAPALGGRDETRGNTVSDGEIPAPTNMPLDATEGKRLFSSQRLGE